MVTNIRVFTLRLSDEVFDKIGILATNEHRSTTNYIEYVLIRHLEEIEKNTVKFMLNQTMNSNFNTHKKTKHLYWDSLLILVLF